MNRVILSGGLGNQLFQYLFALSLPKSDIVFLDKTLLDYPRFQKYILGFTAKSYELDPFQIDLNIVSGDILGLIGTCIMKKINKNNVLNEQTFGNKNIEQTNKSFWGYWQDLSFFDIENLSRIKIKDDCISVRNQDIAKMARNTNSVSVHIRRGDYLSKKNRDYYRILGSEYYDNAISKFKNHKFFVFSDDIEWVKENINIPDDYIFVEHNSGKNSFQDIYIMSNCKNNIIANSTFSWWGAALNKNFEKKVVSPNSWIVGQECKILLPGWDAIDID
jgi:hypothetical protein